MDETHPDFLYHGTTLLRALDIASRGILPRSLTLVSNFADQAGGAAESHPGYVYLSDCFAPSYAAYVSSLQTSELPAIVEVDVSSVDKSDLRADEDFFEFTLDASIDIHDLSHRHLIAKEQTEIDPGEWIDSLRFYGTCAHFGPIPPEAITRVAVVSEDMVDGFRRFCPKPPADPCDLKLWGARGTNFTQWMMAGVLGPSVDLKTAGLESAKTMLLRCYEEQRNSEGRS